MKDAKDDLLKENLVNNPVIRLFVMFNVHFHMYLSM